MLKGCVCVYSVIFSFPINYVLCCFVLVQTLGIGHAFSSFIWLCGPITGLVVGFTLPLMFEFHFMLLLRVFTAPALVHFTAPLNVSIHCLINDNLCLIVGGFMFVTLAASALCIVI